MEPRFRLRLDELIADAVIPPGLTHGLLPRLETFLHPFVQSLRHPQQHTHAHHYVMGLLSDLNHKTAEAIAYFHDEDRQGLQKFIGQSAWDHEPLLTELARQVGTALKDEDAVLVFDPSSLAKKGTESVGVQRQWCGRLGKVENCQVGIYLGYVSRHEHALVDVRLYLPEEWATDRIRRKEAGVPRGVRFRTRHELALEMLAQRGPLWPHRWLSGDDEMGRCSWFRQELRQRNERYLLAVPSHTTVRDLAAESVGQGPNAKAPLTNVAAWCAGLAEERWQTIEVRDGEKGPLVVQGVWTLVQARTEGRLSREVETLVAFREEQGDGSWKHDYLLSNGSIETPLAEYARVFKAQHRIEECFQRAKGEAGLGDYQVRTWEGWHHHQTLALLATWFLTEETRRGKNPDPGVDGESGAGVDRGAVEPGVECAWGGSGTATGESLVEAKRGGEAVSLETTQPLAA